LELGSLNDTKLVPATLRPLTTSADVRDALLCLASAENEPIRALAFGDGTISSSITVKPPLDLFASGWEVDADRVEELAIASRGVPRHFVSLWGAAVGGVPHHENRLLGTTRDSATPRAHFLRSLYAKWKESVPAGSSIALAAAHATDVGAGVHVEPSDVAACFQLADEGVLLFDDLLQTIHFLHPSDIGRCMLLFDESGAAGTSSLRSSCRCCSPTWHLQMR
jgi:hypothetical protein